MQGWKNHWQRGVPLLLWGILGQGFTPAGVVGFRAETRGPYLEAEGAATSVPPATLSDGAAPTLTIAASQEPAPALARAQYAAFAAAKNTKHEACNLAAETLPASPLLRLLRLDGLRHKTDPPPTP